MNCEGLLGEQSPSGRDCNYCCCCVVDVDVAVAMNRMAVRMVCGACVAGLSWLFVGPVKARHERHMTHHDI